MAGRKAIGFSFYVNLPRQVVGTPEVYNVVNNFDYHGGLVSLSRLHGEGNQDYRDRLWDASVHPGGPLYEGIVNAIGREFGLLRQPAITIDLKLSSSGSPMAPNPRVEILANRVVLYSDWRPDGTAVIDREIRTYQLNDPGYYLDNLSLQINQSQYFSASLDAEIRPNTITSTLVRSVSGLMVKEEYVRSDKTIRLKNSRLINGTVVFTEKAIFDKEVTGTPSAAGEYRIDYLNGDIYSYNVPSGQGSCSYYAIAFPMIVDAVPIQVFTLQDDDFQYELFEKRTLDSGEFINALPNPEGAEIYHQLYTETEVFWGE